MHHSIILFADTIEAKALEILDNAQYLEQYGHETLALRRQCKNCGITQPKRRQLKRFRRHGEPFPPNHRPS